MSWLQLANRCAIVTGAASGIGKAVVRELEGAGCRSVLRLDTALAPAEHRDDDDDDDNKSSSSSILVTCDVTDRAQVESVMTMESAKEASILVNCAGITRDNFIGNLSEADWNQVLDVNLTGTFFACQSFLKHSTAIEQHGGGGSIVNVGSVVSEQGNLGQVNYAASKGGVLGLTRSLARETARRGVRVNAVLPGFIATPMTNAVPDHVTERIRGKIALGRFGTPEEVAHLIAFLASDRSRYITGQAMECSGMISL